MPVVPLTIAQIRTGLQSGFSLDETDQFTYSIPGVGSTWESTPGNYDFANPQPTTTYSTLSGAQATQFIAAITAWDELIQPNFTSVADNGAGHGEVRAAFTSDQMGGATAAYAFQGSNQTPTSIVGDVWINSTSTGSAFAYATDDFQTLLHEMGHVLGFKHSFEPGLSTIPAPYENTRYTVMSYTEGSRLVTFTGGGGSIGSSSLGVVVATPMVLDIAYAQDLYGADLTTRSGDTVYTFNQNDTFLQSIYDAGGIDTLDLSSITRPNIVDLNPGAYSSIASYSTADQAAYWKPFYNAGLHGFIDTQLAAPNTYTWNDNLGIAFTTTIENVIGGSGNDFIIGNSADNLFNFGLGGNDYPNGGDGNDGFYFGATLGATDTIDGGAGTNDQLGLQGNYASLTLDPDHLFNVEALVLLPGNDTRFGDLSGAFYDYNLATVDANVGAAQVLTANWNTLRSGEDVTFNGSAETNGSFLTYGGGGTDAVTGGAQSDGFFFGVDRWNPSDSVVGGAGTDDQIGFQGNYTGGSAITFGPAQLSGIETLVLLTGGDTRFGAPAGAGYSYSITMDTGNVAPGQTLIVNANSLRANQPGIADETLTFTGTAELDGGRFVIYGGAGGDWFIASAGPDEIWGGGGADGIVGAMGADDLRGGAGNDSFVYGSAFQSSTAFGLDEIFDFTTGDQIVFFFDADTVNGGDQAFSFLGSGAFSNVPGQARVSDLGGGLYQVEGDTNGDSVADIVISVISDHLLIASDFVL